MAKKKSVVKRKSNKVASKKTSSKKASKKISKRKVTSKKTSSKKSSNINPEHLRITQRKIEKTWRSLLYSGVTFIISLILFLVTRNFLESLFGFIMIISGALILLFLILEIIYYIMKK